MRATIAAWLEVATDDPRKGRGLIVAGGLIETMIEWLAGGLEHPTEEVVDDYARLCAAALEAAGR